MTISSLLDGMRKRIPWPIMRSILNSCSFPVSNGWGESIKKIVGDEDPNRLHESLELWYREHLLVGEKAVKFFSVQGDKRSQVLEILRRQLHVRTSFHETYPLPLPDSKLNSLGSRPHLVETKEDGNYYYLIFCTKRSSTKRIDIDTQDLGEEASQKLHEYNKVIGIKEEIRQFFDIVSISKKSGLVEVRIDFGNEITAEQRHLSFNQIIDSFNRILRDKSFIGGFLEESINLFPLVNKLYESEEGKVCELKFTTGGGSVNHEKMRKRDTDLRLNAYHKAGKKGVNRIYPYYLGIKWEYEKEKLQTTPELILPGRVWGNANLHLEEAIVTKCSGFNDYSFILDRIDFYLNRDK
jgi:hypothetical protein